MSFTSDFQTFAGCKTLCKIKSSIFEIQIHIKEEKSVALIEMNVENLGLFS